MSIVMCYEQFIRKLFKTSKNSSTVSENNARKSAHSDRVLRKRANVDRKTGIESDESWSSLYTCMELLESDSCHSGRSLRPLECKNCAQSKDLRTYRRHYSEYLPSQPMPATNPLVNLPSTVHRPVPPDLPSTTQYIRNHVHQKRRRTWNHLKCSLTIPGTEKSSNSIKPSRRDDSYQLQKTIHLPAPNRNPFDADIAII